MLDATLSDAAPSVPATHWTLATIPAFPGALNRTLQTWNLVTDGDSRTACAAATCPDWPHAVQRLLGEAQTFLHDTAINGQTAAALDANFAANVLPAIQAKQPMVYVLLIGVNDLKGDAATPAATWAHVLSILKQARQNGLQRRIVLLGELPSSLVTDATYHEYLALERTCGALGACDVFIEPDPRITPTSVYSQDGTHPSANGYTRIAVNLYPVLAESAYELLHDGGAP